MTLRSDSALSRRRKEVKDMASDHLPILNREAENACCVWDGQTLLYCTHTCILQQALVSYHVDGMAGTLVHRWVYRYGVDEFMNVLLGGNWKVLVVDFFCRMLAGSRFWTRRSWCHRVWFVRVTLTVPYSTVGST
jgi:hypothetical protein